MDEGESRRAEGRRGQLKKSKSSKDSSSCGVTCFVEGEEGRWERVR